VIRVALLLLLSGCDVVPVADGLSIPCPIRECKGWKIVIYTDSVTLDARSKTSGVVGAGIYYDAPM
jgi:hypothetical protein